jgi:predicted transcriptional regulator
VRPDEELSSVLRILTEDDINQLPVVQDNKIGGMVSRENLLNFISVRSGLDMQRFHESLPVFWDKKM